MLDDRKRSQNQVHGGRLKLKESLYYIFVLLYCKKIGRLKIFELSSLSVFIPLSSRYRPQGVQLPQSDEGKRMLL